MTDPTTRLTALHRPRTLIRAARAGLCAYRRERDLPRLIGREALPPPGTALGALIEAEALEDAARRAGDVRYGLCRHIDLLIALMAEERLRLAQGDLAEAAQTTAPRPMVGRGAAGVSQTKASGSEALRSATKASSASRSAGSSAGAW